MNTLRLAAIPITVSWILIGVADSVIYLYVARLLSGITLASCLSIMPIYLGEIAAPQIRGRLTVAVSMAMKIGILISYSIGPFVSFRLHAFISAAPPILFLFGSVFLPESPYFLLGGDRWDKASESLGKLRGANSDSDASITTELHGMYAAIQKTRSDRVTFYELSQTRGHRRALAIILTLASIQALCGIHAILTYSQLIFGAMDLSLRPSEVSIIMAALQVTGAFVSSTIVDRLGRRPLVLFSVWGTTLCNATVTVYFMLDRWQSSVTPHITWLAMAAILAFIVCFSVGLPCVNLAILSEIFPTNLKAIAGLVYTMTTALLAFAVIALFPMISSLAGSEVAFGTFTAFGLVYSMLVWWLVPETKGKPFEEILQLLEGL